MSQLYARIFLSILDSSIAEDWQVRHVFEDMLKLADGGVLDMTRQAFARRTNIPLAVVNDAIKVLESADPASRDPEEDGRRIVRLDDNRDWGWHIVNWEKYESIKKAVDQRQKTRDRVRRHREGQKQVFLTPPSKTDASPDSEAEQALQERCTALRGVTPSKGKSRFAPPSLEQITLQAAKTGLPEIEAEKFFNHYTANGWRVGGKTPMQSWQHALANWKLRGQPSNAAKPFSKPDHAKGF